MVRKVVFGKATNNLVYPNPVTDGVIYIQTTVECTKVELFDITGKLLQTFNTRGTNNPLNISKVTSGIYELRIFTLSDVLSQKIIIK